MYYNRVGTNIKLYTIYTYIILFFTIITNVRAYLERRRVNVRRAHSCELEQTPVGEQIIVIILAI